MTLYKNLHKCIVFPHSYPLDGSPSPWNARAAARIIRILQVTSAVADVPWRPPGISRRFCFGGWSPEGPQGGRRLPRHHRPAGRAGDAHAVDPRRCDASCARDKRGSRRFVPMAFRSRIGTEHRPHPCHGHPRRRLREVDGQERDPLGNAPEQLDLVPGRSRGPVRPEDSGAHPRRGIGPLRRRQGDAGPELRPDGDTLRPGRGRLRVRRVLGIARGDAVSPRRGLRGQGRPPVLDIRRDGSGMGPSGLSGPYGRGGVRGRRRVPS